jgi:hypothetical protein
LQLLRNSPKIYTVYKNALNKNFVLSVLYEKRRKEDKEYKIGICYFSAKHTALRRKNKDWLSRNQDNVSEHHTNPTKRVDLVQSGPEFTKNIYCI